MKHKTAELHGHELDAMVLVALGHEAFEIRDGRCMRLLADSSSLFEPSTNLADAVAALRAFVSAKLGEEVEIDED